MKKRHLAEDRVKCCEECEWAKLPEGEDFPEKVLCTRSDKEKNVDDHCRFYVYDLLKRVPRPRADIPTLDPEAIV